METIIKSLVEFIREDLIHDMQCGQCGDDITILVLNAYNRYQEDERDGVDYIFNINKAEDLKCCIDGGMTANEISWVFTESQKTAKNTPYFMFGQNHKQPEMIETWDGLKSYLSNFLGSVLLCMLAYHDTDGYKQLYDHCISDYMINNNLV